MSLERDLQTLLVSHTPDQERRGHLDTSWRFHQSLGVREGAMSPGQWGLLPKTRPQP